MISYSTCVVAAKSHVCDFCGGQIIKGQPYSKFSSRITKQERFPVVKKVCNKHNPNLVSLSYIIGR